MKRRPVKLTYATLPREPAPCVCLLCPNCRAEYSALRSDYFYCDASLEPRCGRCWTPLRLVRRIVHYRAQLPEVG